MGDRGAVRRARNASRLRLRLRLRLRRRLAFVVVAVMALVVAAPPADVAAIGSRSWPIAWLRSLLPAAAWSAPPTPVQQTGTARGGSHYVAAEATRAGRGVGRPRGKGIGELDPYQPHERATRPVTTGLAGNRDRFDPTTSRRIASAASATSDVYQNADGSYTRRISLQPLNFRAPDGS